LPEEPTGTPTLEEFETMLAESIDRWDRELREKGIQEGIQEGIQKGIQKGIQEGEARMLLQLLRLKFGPLAPGIEERVDSADADSLLEWGKRILNAETLADVFEV
jgi:flagellar biosynthesis/type III secretory pathway protein FliH